MKLLKANFKTIGAKVDEFVSDCKLLIRTCGPESDTSELDTIINRVCNMWLSTSSAVADQEREVDLAVQQLGRYEDAYTSLLNWIEETEELVENQRPPSADAKTAKAQLHSFDVLMKHVEDKDCSVKGFSALISKFVAILTAEEEVKALKQRDEEINKRYNDLVVAVHDRQQRLIKAVDLAEGFAKGIVPLDSWLNQAEKRLSALGKIPTDVERMEKKLEEQGDLEDEVSERAEDINRTLAIVPILSALVGVEDANNLEAQANHLTCRYESISQRVRLTKDLLNDVVVTVKDLFADISNLEVWLPDMEKKMKEISEIAIAPDDLNEQSNIVADLVMAITKRDEQIAAVMEVGRQLCKRAGGEEALVLQHRIDQIRRRCENITTAADEKLAMLAKAIPLSERFHDGFDAVMEWIEAIEEDLIQIDTTDLDTQVQLLFSMEEGVSRWRPEVDDLVAVSSQLQALSSPDQAEELFQSTVEMMRRVNQIAEKVARRAERLDVTGKQSRAVFDELNFLVEWLGDARDRVIASAAPSVDPEFIHTQLRSQQIMNDDVTANKGRLRELTIEVKKFCRDLVDETGQSGSNIAEQCDHAKDLIDEVTTLCMDRTEILERALALSQHLTVEFDRLSNFLDQVDDELRAAPELTTATPPHQIQEQRAHNSELSAALMSYLPVVEQFRSDVDELKDICVHEDGIKLGELADELVAKYEDMRKAVGARGRALDSIVDATSGLGERVDNFTQTLQEVFDRLHQNTTFSSDLALLKSQIADNNAIKEGLRYKKAAYTALKESASELLSSVPTDDLSNSCISKKLTQLSDLWSSLEKELDDRVDLLGSVLVKVNHFWNELDGLQRAIDDLRMRLESVEPAAGQPQQLQQQQQEMQAVASDSSSIENKLTGLREAAAALSGIIHPEEQIVINAQVDAIHEGWESIAKLLASKNRDLLVATEEAVSFQTDLTQLLDWLGSAEARLAMFPTMETLKVDEVPLVLTKLHILKDEMDKKAIIKEQLSYTAMQIANGAPFHHGAAVRQPINKLNLRWSQLYAALSDRESKIERMLLQMGRLSEATNQLVSWMRKTAETLREMSVNTPILRELEIRRYQLNIVSNDIHAHESSVAALNAASQRLIRDDQNTADSRKMDEMNKEWKELNRTLQELADQLDHAKVEAEKVGQKAEQWVLWLDDVESQLTTTRLVGGLPETAQIQLDDFLVLKAEIAQNIPALDAYIDGTLNDLNDGDCNTSSWPGRNHAFIRKRWERVKELCADREKKLQLALEEAIALDVSMRDTAEWLTAAEKTIGRTRSYQSSSRCS
ncbi:hypothetical protein KIN20_022655 [Parelaphostrongylus tenuis]|uniref:Uncharacterized protein n=1 Tax=Parelaphostrongylus tenuis TaxID=148309 RepID=A0AAD5MQK6_PARTN|nr:hypothetical protein KIN20_022655 [Parelaphostrongylus tenuis]